MALPDVASNDPHVVAHNDERHELNAIRALISSGGAVTPAGVVAALADPTVLAALADVILTKTSSGVYTPTVTGVANATAGNITAGICRWNRTGNVVRVGGRVQVAATSASTLTKIGIALPVASNLSVYDDLTGVAVHSAFVGALCQSDLTNDRAELSFTPGATAAAQVFFEFSYKVA